MVVVRLEDAGTSANVLPLKLEPVQGTANQSPPEEMQLVTPPVLTVNWRAKVIPGRTGDMFETWTVCPPMGIAVPLGGGATAVIVSPVGAVRTSELNEELPVGFKFLKVAVSVAGDPADDGSDMVRLKILSCAIAGSANATSATARNVRIALRRLFILHSPRLTLTTTQRTQRSAFASSAGPYVVQLKRSMLIPCRDNFNRNIHVALAPAMPKS